VCRWPTGKDYALSLTVVNDAYVNGMGGMSVAGVSAVSGEGDLPVAHGGGQVVRQVLGGDGD